MTEVEFISEFERLQKSVEDKLCTYFQDSPVSTLKKAMKYSLDGGGKRVRPVLTLAFCAAAGGTLENALDAACAVEMLHTYTLIHDDLPCMDDSGMRRGKPSNHVEFGEWTAVLAGDALQSAAFETLLSSGGLPPERILRCARFLAEAAGERGVCAGQTLDMLAEEQGIAQTAELYTIHELKTAALINAACLIGVAAAGGSPEQEQAAGIYARGIGLSFQIRDDVLDNLAASEVLGKPAGADGINGKVTFFSVYGEKQCERIIAEQTLAAKKAIKTVFKDNTFLLCLADTLAKREK